MILNRRAFLKYCTAAAAGLGLSSQNLEQLRAAVRAEDSPVLIWLHGSGCQGDSISFLNLFADLDPLDGLTAAGVLTDHVNLAYHTVLMASAGEEAVTMADLALARGGHVLILEGGVPRAFDGKACVIQGHGDLEITYGQAVAAYGRNAKAVISVGSCACYGGIPRSSQDPAQPNGPTDVISAKEALHAAGVLVPLLVNIPGCPAHPDWIAWAVVQLILGNPIPLDPYDRPVALYGNKAVDFHRLNIHENCPRNPKHAGNSLATTFGQDHRCLEDLGCRGPSTFADCPTRRWNWGENGPTNWCVDANAPCLGCVEPDFPNGPFYS